MTFQDSNGDDWDEAEMQRRLASTDPKTRADALFEYARKEQMSGNTRMAITHLEVAVTLLEGCEDKSDLAFYYELLANSYRNEKKFELELENWNKACVLAESNLNLTKEIDAQFKAGLALASLKRYDEAAVRYAYASRLATNDDYFYAGYIAHQLGRALRKLGRFAEALSALELASGQYEKHGHDERLPKVENEIVATLLAKGDIEAALAKARSSHEFAKYSGDKREADKATFLTATSLNKLGRHDEALPLLEGLAEPTGLQPWERFQQKTLKKHQVRIDFEKVKALEGLGRHEDAAPMIPGMLEVARRKKMNSLVAELHWLEGQRLFVDGEFLDAQLQLSSAASAYAELGMVEEEAQAHAMLALVAQSLGDKAEVKSQLKLIVDDSRNTGSFNWASAVIELFHQYALEGNFDAARDALVTIDGLPSELINEYHAGRVAEGRAELLLSQGEVDRARAQFVVAMQKYLLSEMNDEAKRCADRLEAI